MPHMFIADSEDEEDDVSPQSPPPARLPPLANGQSSDPLSRGTDSTDTAFFKSVYHEHAEAIQKHTKDEGGISHHSSTKRVSDGDGMWDVPSSPAVQTASGRRKRRRLSNDRATSPSLKAVEGQESERTLPRTLQIDNEAAFVITPNPLTNSQREVYQDINYGSSLDRGPVSTLQAHGQKLLDLASSSSGTNLNSPRTTGALTQLADTQELPPTAPCDTLQEPLPIVYPQAQKARPRRYSSPDVIAVAGTADLQHQYREPTGDDEDIRAAAFSVPEEEEQEPEDFQEPVIIEDDDSPFDEEPVKKKKKRGRPKKAKSKNDNCPVVEEPVTPTLPEQTAKKKRGRPRKSQSMPEKSAQQDIVETRALIEPDGQPSKPSDVTKKGTTEPNNSPNIHSEAAQEVATEAAREGSHTRESNTVKGEQGASKSAEGKVQHAGKGSSTPIGARDEPKPVYRVGLSKRTRIAPLLKIIRK